jgi:transposase
MGSGPQHYGQHVTMPGALSVQGLHAVMTVDSVTAADAVRPAVRPVLGPTPTPGAMVVRANLREHKAVGSEQAMARRGVRLRSLPPYSPDLSPIEPCWSKTKTALRKVQARTREAFDRVITGTLSPSRPLMRMGGFGINEHYTLEDANRCTCSPSIPPVKLIHGIWAAHAALRSPAAAGS